MKTIKDELQNIILRDEQTGSDSPLKKTQSFLSRYAETSGGVEKQQHFKDKETAALLVFVKEENLLYNRPIPPGNFLKSRDEIASTAQAPPQWPLFRNDNNLL